MNTIIKIREQHIDQIYEREFAINPEGQIEGQIVSAIERAD